MAFGSLMLFAVEGRAQQIEVSPKRQPHTRDATVAYAETKVEAGFEPKDPAGGSGPPGGANEGKAGTLKGYKDKVVAWFGIVRELPVGKDQPYLIEHRYYDGLNDDHMQLASLNGAGDFRLLAADPKTEIKHLCLVRVIGTVTEEKDGVPTVKANYIRVWNLGDFAFMDYGKNGGNPRWRKLLKRDPADTYSPEPDAKYYEDLLGK